MRVDEEGDHLCLRSCIKYLMFVSQNMPEAHAQLDRHPDSSWQANVHKVHSTFIIKHLHEYLTTGEWFALLGLICSDAGLHTRPKTDCTSFLCKPSSLLLDNCMGRWFSNAAWQKQFSVIIISGSSTGLPAKRSRPAEWRQLETASLEKRHGCQRYSRT